MKNFFSRNLPRNILLISLLISAFLYAYFRTRSYEHPDIQPLHQSEEIEDEKVNHSSELDAIPLENRIISLNSIENDVLAPHNTKNVFFLFDSITDSGKFKKLSFREICSIESAVFRHPHHIVFIAFLTINNTVKLEITKSFYGVPYKNIRLVKINLLHLIRETPWRKLAKIKQFEHSSFDCISKLIRFVLLWKYGGIFVDNKMVLRKSLENQKSFLCKGTDNTISDTLMKFEDKNILEILINSTVQDFQFNKRKNYATKLKTKPIEGLCEKSLRDEGVDICQGFNLMPKEFCEPLTKYMELRLFDTMSKDKVMNVLKHAVIVHLWNLKSKDVKIKKYEKTAASELMKEACPESFRIESRKEI